MNKIVCGEDNLKAFRSELKAVLPAFYDELKRLYAAGMIEGLRGAELITGPFENEKEEVVVDLAEKKTCSQCSHWRRDTIGFGEGIGTCQLNSRPSLLKYPGVQACNKFSEVTNEQ
jgi:hypothetical protein